MDLEIKGLDHLKPTKIAWPLSFFATFKINFWNWLINIFCVFIHGLIKQKLAMNRNKIYVMVLSHSSSAPPHTYEKPFQNRVVLLKKSFSSGLLHNLLVYLYDFALKTCRSSCICCIKKCQNTSWHSSVNITYKLWFSLPHVWIFEQKIIYQESG